MFAHFAFQAVNVFIGVIFVHNVHREAANLNFLPIDILCVVNPLTDFPTNQVQLRPQIFILPGRGRS
ncbi:hypothetical protein SDC9_135742 [bioreactor metagenome]|uniref:Uncharacterized protein n=1 Tax=bioreactor metagenome TaxID=1076179 RepID=A0A645DHZ9_9ZZZZ